MIKSKREVRAHPANKQMENDSHEWFYWNRVWPSEVALSEYLIQEFYHDQLSGRTVLELGCGTGLAGMVAAKLGGRVTFSDKIPIVMDSVEVACQMNGITDFRTWVLDWSKPQELVDTYDLVLGSEIFYEEQFLQGICALLTRVLRVGGRGMFCDPNRLGFDVLHGCFSHPFQMRPRMLTVHWPPKGSGQTQGKKVYLYDVKKNPDEI